ncbi:hypothetical protein COLO4_32048 [Corchorus olitorius]|uniref:Uncharacterized protein n=1 Tax=Corchorus olitorius TaxID=93759 RepID=A0A1R3H282_9ROSI|nr:hypothetical protein COLO4_32048 [Corchorus olitorius]
MEERQHRRSTEVSDMEIFPRATRETLAFDPDSP